MQAAKFLVSLRIYAGSSETSLLIDVISTEFRAQPYFIKITLH